LSGFVLFHVLTVVSTLVSTHGVGEGQAFLVALLGFPLFLLALIARMTSANEKGDAI